MFRRLFVAIVFSLTGAFTHAADIETISVVVEKGDQLGTIAERYFKRPAYINWPEIAKLNNIKSEPYAVYPGMVLRLPARLFATQSSPAKWTVVTGNVRMVIPGQAQSVKAVVGDVIPEGTRIIVGVDASAVMELPDASQVKLLGGSHFVLEESRYYRGRLKTEAAEKQTGTKAFSGLMRLLQGSIETRATPATDRAKPLRIQTPTTVVGVRGTDFRVAHGFTSATDKGDALTRSEVVQGLVSAALDEKRKADVPGGYGVLLDPKVMQIPAPVALLEPPSLRSWVLKQEATTLEFTALPSEQSGRRVTAYRVQMATDEAMSQVIFNQRFDAGKNVRIPTSDDGIFYIVVRGVDIQGLEGKEAKVAVSVSARPLPPIVQAPKNGEKLAPGANVTLLWAKPQNVNDYILEVTDPAQKRATHAVQNPQFELRNLTSGIYTWRIAARGKSGANLLRTGPWSELQSFTVLSKLDAPDVQVDESDRSLQLRWTDQKAKEYEVQVSREADFGNEQKQNDVLTYTVKKPELDIPDPAAGKHFIRYRAVDENGVISSWSDPMEITVPKDWRSLWLLIWTAITIAL